MKDHDDSKTNTTPATDADEIAAPKSAVNVNMDVGQVKDSAQVDGVHVEHIHGPVTIIVPASDQLTARSPDQPTLQPNFAHTYPLQPNFTGRVVERQMLTQWLKGGETPPLLALTAIGGMGKSALAWYWLTHDILNLGFGSWDLTGVMWWSFYERAASFEAFLDEALSYLGGGRVNPNDVLSLHDKVRQLVSLLQAKRVLLVLDGFERELRAYHRTHLDYCLESKL